MKLRVAVIAATMAAVALPGAPAAADSFPQPGDGGSQVTNVNSLLCLHVQNGSWAAWTPADQTRCAGGRDQRWEMATYRGGWMLLANIGTFGCLEAQTDYLPVVQNGCDTQRPGQHWYQRYYPVTAGGTNWLYALSQRFELVNELTGGCLQIFMASQQEYEHVVQAPCDWDANQLWQRY